MSSSTLDFYWGLSSLDEKQRIDSATQLIAALVKFQNSMPQTDEMATNEEEMAKMCASDVAYAIPRLIKGLASPRDGARQGFSIALSELLARIPCISVKLVLSLLWRFTEATNSMKGQEQRDMRFGRIFGLMALVQSGIIERTGTTAVDIRKIVMELTAIGSRKSYLREISYVTLTSMVPVLGKFEFKDELITMFVAVALDKGTIETPDELYLAMRLRREYPAYNWYTAFPHWQGKHMLGHKNVGKLAAILCETSTDNPALFSTWHSQLHTVWTEIFDLYFNKERAQEVADMAVMDFEVVWDHVVERGLFAPGASQFRRYWGFLLLERLMPHLSEENVPAMMTPNIVRGLSDNISLSGKSLLAKVGLRTAEKLIEICEGNTAVGLAVLTHLLNQRTTIQSPGPNTNNLRSMMANRIVAKLDSQAIIGYVDYLQKVFVTPKLARKNTTGVADPIMVTNVSDKSIEKQRGWAIDQMIRVAKYGQLPITDELTTNVLHFITAQAALKTITTIGTSGCGVAELEVRPTPPLSSASREYCAVTLISFVGDLNRMSTHKKDDTADAAADAAAASAGRLSTGCSRNGTVWSTAVIAKLLDGAANAKVGVSLHGFEEIKPTLVKMLQVMRSMEARSVQYTKKSIDTALRFRALELLLGNICMMATFTVDSGLRAEYLEVIPELHECFEKIIVQLDPTGKKAKKAKKAAAIAAAATPAAAAELSEDDEPKPVEVLTDILISLLTKDSNSLRKLCEQVFAPFTGLMTSDALDSIIGVLQAREGVTGDDDGNVETQMELIDGEQDIDVSHSGSDSDSDSDDELEQVEAVDEELRRKIEEALGNGSGDMDQAERSASGEEEEFDDDQMKVFDDKLAEIFHHKKQQKQDARDLKISFVNFKLRVLDLADTFMARQPESPLVLRLLPALLDLAKSTHKDSRSKPVHDRAMSILSARRAGVPKGFELQTVLDLLASVHERARRAADKSALKMLSSVAAYLARTVLDNHPEAEPQVFDLYRASLTDFMTRKASQLFADFFSAACLRMQPAQLQPFWRIAIASVAEYGRPLKAVNVFRQVQAYALAETILAGAPRLSAEDGKPFVALTAQLLGELQKALQETFAYAGSDLNKHETTGKLILDQQRMREIMQFSVKLITRCVKSDVLREAVDGALETTPEWTKSLGCVVCSPSFNSSQAVKQLCSTLANIHKVGTPKAKKEKAKASAVVE